jgi:two-component system alkaline phosphatase synthesis response regulator PhoP
MDSLLANSMVTEPFILYIEDERPILELVREAFKLAGHKITGATSGRQGIELMRERPPSLVLLDLMMPGFNGWDVYRAMKEDESLTTIPVIVVTAKVPSRGRVLIEDLPPVEDYITKPFDVEQLVRSVENYI